MSNTIQRIAILGATGSIGTSTLDVITRHPGDFELHTVTAHRDVAGMERICRAHHPARAVMADPDSAAALARRLQDLDGVEVACGDQCVAAAAADPAVDTVVAAIVGAAGLASCLAAVEAGKKVLLANKEALVVAGELVMTTASRTGARILPVDSEHNGVFQCLPGRADAPHGHAGLAEAGVTRLILTASGGPFRERDPATFAQIRVDEACAHPTWRMGRKISVDSATMMNKGLEVIEACRFFQCQSDQVGVVIHPQSLVHALVQYRDGSTLAQLGAPDMRTPIAHALGWPGRLDSGVAHLDITRLGQLDFLPPDGRRFPCLELARDALEAGATATAALNGANEAAVEAFIGGSLRFDRIHAVIEQTLEHMDRRGDASLDDLVDCEQWARTHAADCIRQWGVA
ncbi:1-deoxy-D-xylulose-5-phosphate reductoisomerase [Spiribacter sp. 218]|uniref:1-deoxy-D-xylulose-5-phosphate reductoisomerase n=1 Tax=Spiribacter pallidus TaxID=1987936 RepID=UPI00349F7A55